MSTDTRHDCHLEELQSSYALGLLEGEELRWVEEHLAEGCETCEAELREMTNLVAGLADSVEAVAPSQMVRTRTLRAVEATLAPSAPRTTTSRSGSGLSPAWRFAMAAGLALLIWSGWTQFELRREVEQLAADRAGLSRELDVVRTDLSDTRAELARTLLASRIVSAPRSRSVLLAGLEASPESSARTYVDPGTSRAVFYASNLEPLAADKTYQLWFIADGKPVSAGVFGVDSEGSGSVLVENVAAVESLQAWAVTVEPAGGVPQPTGDMVLLGSVT